ncbi:MAG TPA: hypothetical protein VMD53_01885 [Rhizomicrobium sp.]|nr:hypothetical protein [Rhizomicrobium sp.]
MSITTAPVKSAGRTYIRECAAAMALYIVATWARPWLIAHAPNRALAMAAIVLPAIPVWLLFVAVWRYYLHIDEYQKHQFLQSLAISFGLGSCALVTYNLLIDAGLPRLDISWAWPILGIVWLVASIMIKLAYRR